MPKQSVKTAISVAVIVCMMAVAAGHLSAAPAAQQKSAVKKGTGKRIAVKLDSIPVAAPDSSKADTVQVIQQLFSFRVITEPESAAVLLDDSLKGYSPCTLSGVAPGGHVVTFKKSGYYLKKAEISVDSALSQELSFILLRPAFLRVTSDPAGAALSIDGKEEGKTPYENDKVKPGDHAIKVEMKQYTVSERTLTVKNGGRDTVHFSLEHTKAYRDAVETALRAAEKLRKDRFTFTAVSAIFCLVAILLIVIEANNQ